jgi:phosphoenolpyruvate---glycerone phosphotransferase subunit DhaL
VITTETMRDILLTIADRIDAARDELDALDAALGDGDLGISMAKGFDAVRSLLQSEPPREETPGGLLVRCSLQLQEAAPSTLVTLLAMAFVSAGTQVKQEAALDGAHVHGMFEAMIASLQRRGKAQVGDKTILDALAPAAGALGAALESGASLEDALAEAADAAERGAEGTRALQARHGRAGRYFEQSIGHEDAGAAVGAILVAGFAQGVRTSRGQ